MLRKHHKGFTIIEMLLVIAIIGALIVFTVRYYTNNTKHQKITQAYQQITRILQAASTYYIDYGKWPQTLSQPDFADQYITKQDQIDPWGQPITGRPLIGGFRYQVEVTADPTIGTQIANLLPDATYNKPYLIAQIILPRVTPPPAYKVEIGGIGIAGNGDKAVAVCSANKPAKFYSGINYVNTKYRTPAPSEIPYAYPISSLQISYNNCQTRTQANGTKLTTCTVNIDIRHRQKNNPFLEPEDMTEQNCSVENDTCKTKVTSCSPKIMYIAKCGS